jgi:hypothetical protein
MDVLCFSEHWLKEEYIKLIIIDKFKLVSYFSRRTSDHGCSCIYVRQHLHTKEVHYLHGISKEKYNEMIEIELMDYNFIIVCVCVYRSPDGDCYTFLRSLELTFQKVQLRNKG